MRRGIVVLLCAVALLPLVSFAADFPAGFAPGSLWLSKTTAISDDSVKIYTVVYDSSDSAVEGDVAFSIDATPLGTSHFKLAAGETQIVSLDWTAALGAHAFSAAIKNISGATIPDSNVNTNTVTINVAAAVPSPISQATNLISDVLASSTPLAQNAVQSILATTENLRNAGADFLASQLTASATSTSGGSEGQVLGAETYRAPAATPTSTTSSGGIVSTVWRTILSFLLIIFRNSVYFYPFFALLFFILLYMARKIFLRPRY